MTVENGAYSDFLALRRREILDAIAQAATRSGRDASDVEAIAVSKTVGPEELLAAWRAGWRVFGENRPQELSRKLAFVERTPELSEARFDMIGNLQRNKVNQVVGRVGLIQSISSERLAKTVSEHSQARGITSAVLLEVNVSGEESKSGFSASELREQVEGIAQLPGIRIEGLMTMAPAHDPSAARATFSGLRELVEQMRVRTGLELPTLSCGMSDDYQIAVEEGSTLVRLGRCVFSPDYGTN